MYSTTLGIAAYALFGSSLTTFFYLFRENIKKCLSSPHNLFTISDALSSIFAGLIFLLNQLNMNTTVEQETSNVINNNKTSFNPDILHMFKYSKEEENSAEIENPTNCELNIIMHYGMFFIPFTNAFLSLLGYSLHYIMNITHLDGSCTESIKIMKQFINEKKTIHQDSMENEPTAGSSTNNSDLEEIVSNDDNLKTLNNLREINFDQSSKYKMTIINILIQWLLPLLITIILHFGDYPKMSIEERMTTEDNDCIFTSNFPFDHCSSHDNLSSPNSEITKIKENDTIQSNIHSQEIDAIVSNIYKLVNDTLSENTGNSASVNFWNVTLGENNFSLPNIEFVDDWKLFDDLEKNHTNFQPVETIESETNVNNENSVDKENYNFNNISKNDIYEDIINKIKNGIKNKRTRNMVLLNDYQCLKNQCLVSTNFLKIHLFILLFIVYFIPILVSTIINVCVSYKFRQIREKIETNCQSLKIFTYDKNKDEEIKNIGWFPESGGKHKLERISPVKIQIIEDDLLKSILKKLETEQKFTKILKINLFLAIILWTPLFMEILFNVFLCMKIPNWLMDSSFLSAISFAIARNYLNINIMKTLKADERAKKENSIHPSL